MKIELLRKLKKTLGKGAIRTFYRFLWFLSDEQYVSLVYRLRMGKKLDLENPKTFTEKLQYLKVYDHQPIYTQMADKIGMRSFVDERIGKGHTVPILGCWNHFKEIDFHVLPSRFALKCTHDSGSYVICRNKDSLDKKEAEKRISSSLKRNYYRTTREWQYKNIEPRIIAEAYLEDREGKPLTDYKFFCFNGEPKFMYAEEESAERPTQAIFDMEYRKLPFSMEDESSDDLPLKPKCFDEMKFYAEKLSESVPFLRVDMYEVNGVIYIGEMTFYHYGGFTPFKPVGWDLKLGEWITLPKH